MRYLFILLLSLISLYSFGHQDLTFSLKKDNISLDFTTGWKETEILNKCDILLELTSKLLKDRQISNTKIHIKFKWDYTKKDTTNLSLGYIETKSEIILKIVDRDLDILKILNLINFAIGNSDFIKLNQKVHFINLNRYNNGISEYDTLISISPEILKQESRKMDKRISIIANEKSFRYRKPNEDLNSIDYYFQNNNYHFYNNDNSSNKDNLVLKNVSEIIGNMQDGYIIFTNDSIFYHIEANKTQYSGPFKINGISNYRQPIHKFYFDSSNPRKFVLYFYNNLEKLKKIAFFPDKKLVILDYDKLEESLLISFFKTNTFLEKYNLSNNTTQILLTILTISILLNLYLWKNRCKK